MDFVLPLPAFLLDVLSFSDARVLMTEISSSDGERDRSAFASSFGSGTPSFSSSAVGRFHKLALNLARRSSKETAWRKVWTMVLEVVKGSLLGIKPTESTVSL